MSELIDRRKERRGEERRETEARSTMMLEWVRPESEGM